MATQRIRKTKLMRSVEEKHGQPLETLVPHLVNDVGMSRAASQLGVSPGYPGILDAENGNSVSSCRPGRRRNDRSPTPRLMPGGSIQARVRGWAARGRLPAFRRPHPSPATVA